MVIKHYSSLDRPRRILIADIWCQFVDIICDLCLDPPVPQEFPDVLAIIPKVIVLPSNELQGLDEVQGLINLGQHTVDSGGTATEQKKRKEVWRSNVRLTDPPHNKGLPPGILFLYQLQ